jgi:hypothetical protein
MKKLFSNIIFSFSSFILGVKNVFALDIEQPSLYGPAPDPGSPNVPVNPGSSIFNIVSLVSTIVLFLIGIFVLLNKKISNKVKIIVSIIILIILLLLFVLNEFVLFII